MTARFQQVLQSEDFTDATLVSSDNVNITAHKVILSTGSGFFNCVLSENIHPNPLIYLRCVGQEVLHALVGFLYLGHVKVKQELLQAFMETALEMEIHGLTNNEIAFSD